MKTTIYFNLKKFAKLILIRLHIFRYYKLINAFNKITGVPILLNTSFNENEPIVCNPKEALNCFIRTNMDILVMENWIIKRITS
jgi:carbamoyltransferase